MYLITSKGYFDNTVCRWVFILLPLIELFFEHFIIIIRRNLFKNLMIRIIALDDNLSSFLRTPCSTGYLCQQLKAPFKAVRSKTELDDRTIERKSHGAKSSTSFAVFSVSLAQVPCSFLVSFVFEKAGATFQTLMLLTK